MEMILVSAASLDVAWLSNGNFWKASRQVERAPTGGLSQVSRPASLIFLHRLTPWRLLRR
jgi:hypothetical protein